MKILKNLLPAFALILGLSIVAIQSAFTPAKPRLQSTFYYNGPDLSTAEVIKPQNWVYDPDGNTCSATDQQACTIQVDPSFVNSGSNTLKSSINLTASTHSSGTAYVTGSADGTMGIFNEANP